MSAARMKTFLQGLLCTCTVCIRHMHPMRVLVTAFQPELNGLWRALAAEDQVGRRSYWSLQAFTGQRGSSTSGYGGSASGARAYSTGLFLAHALGLRPFSSIAASRGRRHSTGQRLFPRMIVQLAARHGSIGHYRAPIGGV
ncbi:hypothetical protein BU16DRAFT_330595 [Lophium mytilinum]|uniref:Uncharacterized protein n=1 Tax=Lophium mytilinum TaxID=390894 RepID=A0A6A6QZS9_9PEZI|nr:hypothetical protein BU16DRAFT_330595 [Lophium mytilinum]